MNTANPFQQKAITVRLNGRVLEYDRPIEVMALVTNEEIYELAAALGFNGHHLVNLLTPVICGVQLLKEEATK